MAPKKRVTRTPKKLDVDREEEARGESPVKKRTRVTRKKTEKAKEMEEEEELKLSVKKESILNKEATISTKRNSSRKSTVLLESLQPASTPLSPSKRVSSIGTSRIPSPVRTGNLRVNDNLDLTRTNSSVINALQNKNLPRLSSIIDELKSTKQEQIFDNYKSSMELQLHAAKEIISSLTVKNTQLEQELIDTKTLLANETRPETPIKPSNPINEQDFLENELILDMMEQIVGLRIHKVEDTDEALFFDCSQSGKNGILDYRLTISKEDSSEIIYSPLENKEQDVEQLRKCLPEYFFDDLTFPLETLQQFYHKIYRGLNK